MNTITNTPAAVIAKAREILARYAAAAVILGMADKIARAFNRSQVIAHLTETAEDRQTVEIAAMLADIRTRTVMLADAVRNAPADEPAPAKGRGVDVVSLWGFGGAASIADTLAADADELAKLLEEFEALETTVTPAAIETTEQEEAPAVTTKTPEEVAEEIGGRYYTTKAGAARVEIGGRTVLIRRNYTRGVFTLETTDADAGKQTRQVKQSPETNDLARAAQDGDGVGAALASKLLDGIRQIPAFIESIDMTSAARRDLALRKAAEESAFEEESAKVLAAADAAALAPLEEEPAAVTPATPDRAAALIAKLTADGVDALRSQEDAEDFDAGRAAMEFALEALDRLRDDAPDLIEANDLLDLVQAAYLAALAPAEESEDLAPAADWSAVMDSEPYTLEHGQPYRLTWSRRNGEEVTEDVTVTRSKDWGRECDYLAHDLAGKPAGRIPAHKITNVTALDSAEEEEEAAPADVTPQQVARANYETTFRGIDPEEVITKVSRWIEYEGDAAKADTAAGRRLAWTVAMWEEFRMIACEHAANAPALAPMEESEEVTPEPAATKERPTLTAAIVAESVATLRDVEDHEAFNAEQVAMQCAEELHDLLGDSPMITAEELGGVIVDNYHAEVIQAAEEAAAAGIDPAALAAELGGRYYEKGQGVRLVLNGQMFKIRGQEGTGAPWLVWTDAAGVKHTQRVDVSPGTAATADPRAAYLAGHCDAIRAALVVTAAPAAALVK